MFFFVPGKCAFVITNDQLILKISHYMTLINFLI